MMNEGVKPFHNQIITFFELYSVYVVEYIHFLPYKSPTAKCSHAMKEKAIW